MIRQFIQCALRAKIRRAETGSVVVEAAIVYPVFLLLVFSALEFGLIMYTSGLVNDALIEASRYGITGDNYAELQNPKLPVMSREQFIQNFVTQRLSLLCASGSCITMTAAPYNGWTLTNSSGAAFGAGGQIVKYTVQYNWNIISPLLMPFLGTNYVISSSTVVKNEAFSPTSGGSATDTTGGGTTPTGDGTTTTGNTPPPAGPLSNGGSGTNNNPPPPPPPPPSYGNSFGSSGGGGGDGGGDGGG
jgi:Flp pilus assembly protein TadG